MSNRFPNEHDPALPPADRTESAEALADARRRDVELTSGAVTGRSHEEVMNAARRAIGRD